MHDARGLTINSEGLADGYVMYSVAQRSLDCHNIGINWIKNNIVHIITFYISVNSFLSPNALVLNHLRPFPFPIE